LPRFPPMIPPILPMIPLNEAAVDSAWWNSLLQFISSQTMPN
jgi:hypothetical protein